MHKNKNNTINMIKVNTAQVKKAASEVTAKAKKLRALSAKTSIELGGKIRQHRINSGVRRSEVAKALGCSNAMLFLVENPKSRPGAISLRRQTQYAKAITKICNRLAKARRSVTLPVVKHLPV